jgi:glycosyltransferase involved in cell wall biosynthesis
MRILLLNHNVVGAGTYQRASSFAQELARRGHDVTLVTTSRSARVRGRWAVDGELRVLEAPDLWAGPARNGWDPWNAYRRVRLLEGRRFDLVHAFDSRPAVILPALAIHRQTGAALFMDWADWWGRGGTIEERSGWVVRTLWGPVETWFEESFRGRAAGSTVISEALRRRCEALGVAPETIARIPNGCTPPERLAGPTANGAGHGVRLNGGAPGSSTVRSGHSAAARDVRTAARFDLRLDPGSPLIVHVGTVHAGDMALLFDALPAIRAAVPGARLALVGGYRGRVPAELQADGAVLRTGFVPRPTLARWLQAATVCVIPLRDNIANRGRWPGKVNEYLSAGRATVMTRVGDAAGVLAESGAGWICDPASGALAAAIVEALRSPEERLAAEARAMGLACGGLAWARLAERLEAFYSAVLGGRQVALSA